MEVSEEARVIAGRYELESLIGEGGMAAVWRARDLTLERPVAVKLLFARDERDRQNLVDQFLREARIAASVQHRNVIHIVDFGSTDEQQPYMVMELLSGQSLGERLQQNPSLSISELVHVCGLTLRGLAAVHDAGIIHRDLKPDNVFLTEDSGGGHFPKILDFGISRSVEPRSGRRSALTTKEGIIVGTPEYMSPEQARGVKTIDRRTDIYSMGVILYEALTGTLPFSSENVGDLIIQIVTGSAPPVHELNGNIPEALSDVVATAMSRGPENRYQTAVEMQEALLAAVEGCPDAEINRSLSDLPPPPPAAGLATPRLSVDRLRTLEFPLDDSDAPPVAAIVNDHPSTPPVAPASELPADPFGRKRSRSRGLVALAVAAVGVLVAWQLTSGREPPPKASIAAAAPAQVKEPEPPPPPPLPTHVTVELRGVPQGATVTVDGTPSADNPIELPRDNKNRVIKVAAKGSSPWQVVHHASADAEFDVLLVEEKRKPRARPPRRAAAKKPKRTKPPSVLRKLDF